VEAYWLTDVPRDRVGSWRLYHFAKRRWDITMFALTLDRLYEAGALAAALLPRIRFKVNGQCVNTPALGVVGIPFLDEHIEKASLDCLDLAAGAGQPFFMSTDVMKVHPPNLPHPDFIHEFLSKSKYADSVVENGTCIGRVMDKVRALGLDKNTHNRTALRSCATAVCSSPATLAEAPTRRRRLS
jgi:hypothetical protein